MEDPCQTWPMPDPGPDDIGYSDPNRFICTDPGCNGEGCPGTNHSK